MLGRLSRRLPTAPGYATKKALRIVGRASASPADESQAMSAQASTGPALRLRLEM
jgi:hypothetical protein